MSSQQTLGKWRFIFREARSRLFFSLIIGLFLMVIFFKLEEGWWNIYEPLITLLTLGVALLVWYQQMREEWEEDYLPKQFTGKFYFEGKEVMHFENALLTHEGDIRALAQQIGSQMIDKVNGKLQQLIFVAPEVEVTGPQLYKKEKYVHYTISFKLTELPQGIDANKIRIWKIPFINEKGKPSYKDSERNNI